MPTTSSTDQRPAKRRSESRQRTAMVAIRLHPQERDLLDAEARTRNISLSELLRASALDAATGER